MQSNFGNHHIPDAQPTAASKAGILVFSKERRPTSLFLLVHLLLVYNYLSDQQYPIVHDDLSSNFQYHSPDHELGHFSGEIRHPLYEPPKLAFSVQHPQHSINPLKSLKDKFLGIFMKHKQSEYYPAGVGTSPSYYFFFFRNIWQHL